MKKLIVLSLIFLTAFSCGDEVEFNSPAFQGDRANLLWRASAFSASIDANGFLTISGTNNIETVTLKVPSVSLGTYIPGDGGENAIETIEAEYVDGFGTVYSTNNRPDSSVSVYPELGEIVIEEIDLTSGAFTGKFRFLAFDASGLNSVGYANGIFFRVPLVSGSIPANPITCTDKEIESDAALAAYNTASEPNADGFIDSSAFEAACSTYINALNEQRNYCGDVEGALQDTIDELGDCMFTCEQAIANRNEAQLQYNSATIGSFNDKCAQYLTYLQEQIDYCGDEDGSIQTVIDNLDCADDDGDGVPNVFEDFNGDGVFDDDTDMDGTSNINDADDDGDGVPTSVELQLDADGNPMDTDGDGDADYLDTDDDGDGIPTANEDANMDGDPTNDDTDGDGVPDYLQA
ncbi:DUF6252 family protein [Winogradskyella sp.]|jgi:hypothetical protein|uniref:DUF6252 family protein n=1 Tax=Winogradskyella sp. TaxID=1883156 RepID=UPI0025D23981|nr:DUF6252 family protein [Winogradskyella sp.]MCT4630600.1 DUF6252 family protein [Winogradskyella sp.]